MKTDIEIAQSAKLEKINTIAAKLSIPQEALEPYGHYKAKISMDFIKSLESKEETNNTEQPLIEVVNDYVN